MGTRTKEVGDALSLSYWHVTEERTHRTWEEEYWYNRVVVISRIFH